LKKRNIILFFFLPFLGIIFIFFVLSSLNRTYVKAKVEALVKEQLQATAEILKVNFSHFLKENYLVDEIFKLYSQEQNIYYMALLDEKKEVLGWKSRFEGYLPLSLQSIKENESWVIESPAGKIFNHFSSFSPGEGKTYFLYLGYSLMNLEEMMLRSRQNFFYIFGVIFVIGIIVFMGAYQLQRHYLAKTKEAEEERKEKERFREISAFTSGIAHEIKNPLNSLSLFFELLGKRPPPDLQQEISQGKEEIQKISRIMDQFTDFLKPLRLSKEKFKLEEIVNSVIESLKREADQKEIEVRYIQPTPIILNADKGLIGQVFFNLLKNSLEATEKGLVLIKTEQQKKQVLIKVEDSGGGISEEDRIHIFEPFYSRKSKGMGVGLYLVKKIIQAHDGKIECRSELGRGTTFFIQLPGG